MVSYPIYCYLPRLSAVVCHWELLSQIESLTYQLTDNPVLGHITTFGGHPVSCAAGLASLQVIQEERLIEQVEAKGQLFEVKLKHPKIKSVNRKGLMMALEFDSFEQNKKIIESLYRERCTHRLVSFCTAVYAYRATAGHIRGADTYCL
jgi:adenosylmethionine-8-amino-7-oxononanoate aminotransferase